MGMTTSIDKNRFFFSEQLLILNKARGVANNKKHCSFFQLSRRDCAYGILEL